ncbi:FtsX-like permease family protein [uncultured Bacteroides sp.]|uniref:FtsX-like permease family protein n=1 Tax=uncultured Bacteroides sp. TaxID=162156 RepID=UPI00260E99E9|nr:FtsX-like permease family protein [uncultured Bacteroides sp.]
MNYTIIRNLFYTLKRFRTASVLSLIGLSAAFSAFTLIMMKVDYDRSFDSCYPEPDRLVMLNMGIPEEHELQLLPRGPIDYLMEQISEIEYGTIYAPAWQKLALYTDPENPQYFYESPWSVYPDFAKVVGLKFVEGSDAGMNRMESAIVSESYARKLFPKGNALGSYLYMEGSNWLTPGATKYRICGIFEDLPENCQFKNDLFLPMGNTQQDSWGSQNFCAFFRLKPGVSVEEVNRKIRDSKAIERMYFYEEKSKEEFYVFPIKDLYYDMHASHCFKTGSRSSLTLTVIIGFLIIIIACINLVNFSTALTPVRIRSINTQKVLGCTDGELRRALILESVCTVVIGWLISLGITATLIHLNVLSFMGFTPSLVAYWPYVALTGVVAVATGIIAGLYPAWYMTSFPPALVLKGNYALSGKGKRLRMLLIGFQYVVSFVLIVSASFIYLQNRFMRTSNLGFEKDQILVASLPQMEYNSSPYRSFQSKLKSYAEIDDIAFAKWELGASEGYTFYAFKYKDQEYMHQYIDVTTNFFRVMGIDILSGSDFQPGDSIGTDPLEFIATEDLQQKTGIPAGEIIDFFVWGRKARLKGYVNNVQFTSRKTQPYPYVFCPNGKGSNETMPYAYIRVKAGSNMDAALEHIRRTSAECFPGYPTDVKFYDQVYTSLYQLETDQQQMITLFSLLAIIISLVGIFGLIIFEAEHRRKEIGVRHVYGATTGKILWMFGRSYLLLAVISSVIASPIAAWLVLRWMEPFNERVPLSPWVFAGACIIVCLITEITITIQNYRTATANPVDSLKTE